ncbi:hypothetical protein AC244_07775 [Ensifer adhaerens]|uniref:Uncharacterized protein n=1 Tax=Ensifer adhaerens TaxID=106592 RepID=A0A0L8C2X4_ENSAD|nr:hypothetical protein AC244_07775 [Ensifer adhaerens]
MEVSSGLGDGDIPGLLSGKRNLILQGVGAIFDAVRALRIVRGLAMKGGGYCLHRRLYVHVVMAR